MKLSGVIDIRVLFLVIFLVCPVRITPQEPGPHEFISSNLPIVIIDTYGQTIRNEPKITAAMKIIHNEEAGVNYVTDEANVYDGKVGIEIRGHYSASLPQKPYGFETRDEAGNNLNVPLLGMPEENDWVLLANYNDKPFLRNFLAFELFRQMGHYAPRTIYCEVVLNGEYQGIYLLGEKIKQDRNRVDIASLDPDENSGDRLTGGYIFKNDYYTANDSWLSNYSPVNKPGAEVRFVYYDPKPEVLTPQQKSYLKDFVNSFETVLYSKEFADPRTGYRAWLDVSSFINYFLIGELTRNVDAYKKSRFYYKDRDSRDGLIHSGPVWDFDWAWKDIRENCIHFNQTDGSGWAYKINECYAWPVPPSWEVRLMQDPWFVDMIHDKYYLLRKGVLSERHINHIIDSVAGLLSEAQVRHYDKWQILGINVGTPEYGIQPDTFEGEIEKFKSWISRRLKWLDANMVGRGAAFLRGYHAICRIFPNPAGDYLRIESDTTVTRVTVYNMSGIAVTELNGNNDYHATISLTGLSPGLYLARIVFGHGELITRRFIKKE
ncbi:MAG TPA: CotH kinase family protein [Bacteroidales bacterium]|nr:CotH kinase family protein [Bacteroidales bacterium]